MEKLAKIYSLVDPETGETKYIGQTMYKLYVRLSGHLNEALTKPGPYGTGLQEYVYNDRKNVWIREILSKGKRPVICLLAEVRKEDKDYWEVFFGQIYEDYDLLNKRPLVKT